MGSIDAEQVLLGFTGFPEISLSFTISDRMELVHGFERLKNGFQSDGWHHFTSEDSISEASSGLERVLPGFYRVSQKNELSVSVGFQRYGIHKNVCFFLNPVSSTFTGFHWGFCWGFLGCSAELEEAFLSSFFYRSNETVPLNEQV